MNIVCVICSELLIPSDDVFYTPCGHIFHFPCLTQWLERSTTCPQCRERTNQNKIHRIYFNFSNNDTITEDPSSLQDKIDKLKFQILLKDQEIKNYTEKNGTLEKQNVGLKFEVKKADIQIREKETAIYALKEQTKYFKEQCLEVDSTKQEVARLKKKIEDLKNIQIILDAPVEEVDEMITKTHDVSTLVTYISVMKREMTTSLNKRRELRSRLKNTQQELIKVSMERKRLLDEHEKRQRLEKELLICESEKIALQNELRKYKEKEGRKSCSKICSESKTGQQNSDSKKVLNKETVENNDKIIKIDENNPVEKLKNSITLIAKAEENSPYLPVRSKGVLGLQEHYAARRINRNSTFSILTKKPRLSQQSYEPKSCEMITYDGFGGHSKYDIFPTPICGARPKKLKEDISKSKRIKLDKGDNKKLGDFLMNSTCDNTK